MRWSLRNNNNYEQTGIIVSLNYFANNRVYFLRNFYDKSKRSVMKPKMEGPAAYVLPASDPRLGTQAELLRVLQKQGVEISRATAAFTVTLPARPAAAGGGRGGRGGRRRRRTDAAARRRRRRCAAAPSGQRLARRTGEKPAPVTREFPAGSYIVRMDQPYSRIADALLDYQYWAPNDAQTRPYDDTGWTFPEGFGVQAVRITDVKVLDAPMELVKGEVKAVERRHRPGVGRSRSTTTRDNALITLRYRLKDADIQMAEEPFEAGGAKFSRGTFIIKGVAQGDLDKQLTATRPEGRGAGGGADGEDAPGARGARGASCTSGRARRPRAGGARRSTSTAFRTTTSIPRRSKKTANLRAKYDVIIFGPGGGQGAVEGIADVAEPDPVEEDAELPNIGTWAQTDDTRIGMGLEGLMHLRDFIAQGRRVSSGRTAAPSSPSRNNFTYGVSAGNRAGSDDARRRLAAADEDRRRRPARSSTACPTTWRCTATAATCFTVSATAGGGGGRGGGGAPPAAAAGGGRGGGGGGSRPTGRGTQDDPDTVQGRPMYEGTEPQAGADARADAAVAVLAADRRAVEAQPGAT